MKFLESLRGRDFVQLSDLDSDELDTIIKLAFEMKREQRSFRIEHKTLIMLFFNYSLRTRASFEIGAAQLGINVVTVNPGAEGWNLEWHQGAVMDGDAVEHAKDAARVLSRYGDAIGVRSYPPMLDLEEDRRDPLMTELRTHATVPVINLESAISHPCQGLADLMTLRELFPHGIRNKRIVLSWAPHPSPITQSVPNTFIHAAAIDGAQIVLAHPPGFELAEDVVNGARARAEAAGGSLTVTNDREQAFAGAEVVYGKSWVSSRHYGDWEAEQAMRAKLDDWQITATAMRATHRARFMHPLPVRRNVVADDAVLDGPDCVVYQQAENRLHVQKALLAGILG